MTTAVTKFVSLVDYHMVWEDSAGGWVILEKNVCVFKFFD